MRKNEIFAKIEENTKNINPKAFIEHIKNIYTTKTHGNIDGDLTLNRISALYNVIKLHNRIERLDRMQLSVDLLNQYRALQGHKPQGFGMLVEDEQDSVFYCMVEAGFGIEQLRAAAWIVSFDTLKAYDLLHLRNSDTAA